MNTIYYCVAELWRTANYAAKVFKGDKTKRIKVK